VQSAFALLLTWTLDGKPASLLDELRRYVTADSWERYRKVDGLISKAWLSNSEPHEFAAFYLWETEAGRENEVRRMRNVTKITGVEPTIRRWTVEAVQEGQHAPLNLSSVGQAWSAVDDNTGNQVRRKAEG